MGGFGFWENFACMVQCRNHGNNDPKNIRLKLFLKPTAPGLVVFLITFSLRCVYLRQQKKERNDASEVCFAAELYIFFAPIGVNLTSAFTPNRNLSEMLCAGGVSDTEFLHHTHTVVNLEVK